jgi:hypothetical protein
VAYRYLACRYMAVDRWNLSSSKVVSSTSQIPPASSRTGADSAQITAIVYKFVSRSARPAPASWRPVWFFSFFKVCSAIRGERRTPWTWRLGLGKRPVGSIQRSTSGSANGRDVRGRSLRRGDNRIMDRAYRNCIVPVAAIPPVRQDGNSKTSSSSSLQEHPWLTVFRTKMNLTAPASEAAPAQMDSSPSRTTELQEPAHHENRGTKCFRLGTWPRF